MQDVYTVLLTYSFSLRDEDWVRCTWMLLHNAVCSCVDWLAPFFWHLPAALGTAGRCRWCMWGSRATCAGCGLGLPWAGPSWLCNGQNGPTTTCQAVPIGEHMVPLWKRVSEREVATMGKRVTEEKEETWTGQEQRGTWARLEKRDSWAGAR